jgi:hypothetical protein
LEPIFVMTFFMGSFRDQAIRRLVYSDEGNFNLGNFNAAPVAARQQ